MTEYHNTIFELDKRQHMRDIGNASSTDTDAKSLLKRIVKDYRWDMKSVAARWPDLVAETMNLD